ncbi:MAG: hypothetical protein WC395_09190, partial [Bacteroidales bacterium]
MKTILLALLLLTLPALSIIAQDLPASQDLSKSCVLPASWEELTSADFVKATERAQGVCILPMG